MADNKQIEVSLILSAYDKASRIINNMATKGEARLATFAKKAGALGDSAFKQGREFGAIGVGMLAPLFLAQKAAEESEVATKRLANTFKQMGDETGRAAAQSANYASKLQFQIGVEDENIMLVQSKIATFKKVSDTAGRMAGVFDRATNAAFDMAAAGFGEADQNAVQLGKALQSPTQGINALRRSGISFTDAEKKKIKALEESGQLLKAQKIILHAVEMQVKGTAAATATQGQKTKIAYGEAMESLGRTFLPIMNQLLKKVADNIQKVDAWMQRNPKLTKTIVMITAGAAALSLGISALSFMFGGLMKAISFASSAGSVFLKLVKATTYQNAALGIQTKITAISTWAQTAATNAATAATWLATAASTALSFAMKAIPFVAIAAAVIWLATVIYKNWDSIKAFFVKTWDKIKGIFTGAWDWIKKLFEWTPLGQIIKNWDKIKDFFAEQWEGTKKNFQGFVDFLKNIPQKLYEGGKNMIKSLWEGIKAMASKPVEAIKNIVQKVRDFLPFSPAKAGPLRDIHRIKLIETISQNIKPAPMVKAMQKTAAATLLATQAFTMPMVAKPNTPMNIGGGGQAIHIHFNPQVTIQGGGTPDQATMEMFNDAFAKQKKELKKMLEEIQRGKQRTSYSSES